MPDVFWIFAGIALVILASGYMKGMKSTQGGRGPAAELEEIKRRLDRIEDHLDIRETQ